MLENRKNIKSNKEKEVRNIIKRFNKLIDSEDMLEVKDGSYISILEQLGIKLMLRINGIDQVYSLNKLIQNHLEELEEELIPLSFVEELDNYIEHDNYKLINKKLNSIGKEQEQEQEQDKGKRNLMEYMYEEVESIEDNIVDIIVVLEEFLKRNNVSISLLNFKDYNLGFLKGYYIGRLEQVNNCYNNKEQINKLKEQKNLVYLESLVFYLEKIIYITEVLLTNNIIFL